MISVLSILAAASKQSSHSSVSAVTFLLPVIVLALLGGFFLTRGGSRRPRELELAEGDEVLTSGGVYGIVDRVDGDRVWLEVAPNVVVEVQKQAVTSVVERASPPEEKEGSSGAG